mmetsp:Transcript_83183/g.248205  ORF Transcript_83183/g.248205 Transcript_83183/m.248205 type:complete len:475 (+) Transcript_83183:1207-2631(+)
MSNMSFLQKMGREGCDSSATSSHSPRMSSSSGGWCHWEIILISWWKKSRPSGVATTVQPCHRRSSSSSSAVWSTSLPSHTPGVPNCGSLGGTGEPCCAFAGCGRDQLGEDEDTASPRVLAAAADGPAEDAALSPWTSADAAHAGLLGGSAEARSCSKRCVSRGGLLSTCARSPLAPAAPATSGVPALGALAPPRGLLVPLPRGPKTRPPSAARRSAGWKLGACEDDAAPEPLAPEEVKGGVLVTFGGALHSMPACCNCDFRTSEDEVAALCRGVSSLGEFDGDPPRGVPECDPTREPNMLSPSSVGPRDSVSHSEDARDVKSPHSEDATELGMWIRVFRRSSSAATLRSTSVCLDLNFWNCASISSYSFCSSSVSDGSPAGSVRAPSFSSSRSGKSPALKGASSASSSSPPMEKCIGGLADEVLVGTSSGGDVELLAGLSEDAAAGAPLTAGSRAPGGSWIASSPSLGAACWAA